MGKYDLDTPDEPTPATAPRIVVTPRGKYDLDAPSAEQYGPPVPPPTWWDTAKQYGQTAVDFAAAAGTAGTFGLDVRRDALAGWLAGDYPDYSTGVAAEQKKLARQRERSPYASIAGDVTGAALLPGIGGRQLAARYGGGLLARGAGYGAEGAALGAAQGAGTTYTGNPLDYFRNAATGGMIGGVLGAGIGGALGPRGGMRSTAEVPTTPQLFNEKTANYRALENSPARYEPVHLANAADVAEDTLRLQRFHPSRSPATFQALDEMRGAPTAFPTGQAPVSPADIEFIRKGISNLNPVTEATDIASARVVKRALEDFVLNPPAGAVLPGTQAAAREATALAERARGNYGGYRRGQLMDDLIENARTSAGSTYSGLNLQNVLRQGVRGAVRQTKGVSPASRAGYNADEIADMTRFARVPYGDAALRYIDRVMGGGGGIGVTIAGLGGGVGGQYLTDSPWAGAAGVAVPAAGFGLRLLGNRRAARNVDELSEMVRRRTPLYQERAAVAPMVPPGSANAARLRNAITLQMLERQGVPRITVTPREE